MSCISLASEIRYVHNPAFRSGELTPPQRKGGPMAQPVIYPRLPRRVVAAAVVSVLLLLATVGCAVYAWNQDEPRPVHLLYVMGFIWAVVPPAWFWYEYHYIYRVQGDVAGFEQFKYSQQVSVAIWAGVALALFAVATSERFKPPKETNASPAGKPGAQNP
jgi:hypothetical protein